MPGAAVPIVLNQCSRRTPAAGEATWEPTAADVIALESGLANQLHASPIEGFVETSWRSKWNRRYVGIVRGGKRYIYGDFSPVGQPVSVCDGGASWFGVEYDVEKKNLTEIATNGIA